MTRKEREDDDGRDRRCPVKPGMTMEEREDGEERARMTRKAFVMFA